MDKFDHLINSIGISLPSLTKHKMKKSPTLSNRAFFNLEPGDDLLSHNKCYTIIGAVSFHY